MKLFDIPFARCTRCGHQWTPRRKEIRICPKCKSPYWDRDKEQKGGVYK